MSFLLSNKGLFFFLALFIFNFLFFWPFFFWILFNNRPYPTTHFYTSFLLQEHEITISIDDVLRKISLLNVKNPSFLVILFKFEDLMNDVLLIEISNIYLHNLIKIANLLARIGYRYGKCAFQLSKSTPGYHLSEVTSVFIHPHSHFSSMTISWGHFMYAILNNKTINLASVIYMAIFFILLLLASFLFIIFLWSPKYISFRWYYRHQ